MNVLDLDVAPDSLVYWHMTLTLLHMSWIGLVIGLITATGNRVLRNRSANVRYWWNSVSLLAFAVNLPLTFAVVRNMPADYGGAVTNTVTTSVPAPQHGALLPTAPADAMLFTPDQPAGSFNSDRSDRSDRSVQSVGSDRSGQAPTAVWAKCQRISKAASPFVAALYFIGVALMLIKLAIGVRVSRSLRAASQPISDADLLSRMVIQAKKLSLRVVPVIAYCEHVAVPIVIGLLRPIILVPAAMINGLTTEQLESVLTHELAHLRRHDHLLIVVQRVLEAVLFFHPVTWYLSRRIHDERETCCDDLVLAIGGDRLQYAQSLLRVAELRLATTSRHSKSLTALAADGQRPSKLRQRIARLLGESSNDSARVSSVWLIAVLVAFVAASGWVINHHVYDLTSNEQLQAARLPLLQGQLVDPDSKPLAHWTVITPRSRAETDADGKFRIVLRHNAVPSDWKIYSPENSRGVPKVISESPLVLRITDYSRAVLPPGPETSF